MFWVDVRVRMNYSYFGDIVIFDIIYRFNRYRLFFVFFIGVNYYGKFVLFGCVFLINESEGSFVWLFNIWLEVMLGRLSVSIIIDYDVIIILVIM